MDASDLPSLLKLLKTSQVQMPELPPMRGQQPSPPPSEKPSFAERFGVWQPAEDVTGRPIRGTSVPRGFSHGQEDWPGFSNPKMSPEELNDLYSTSTFKLLDHPNPSFRRIKRP